ncbi:uncharacterized protein [Glycine max]|uniref:uncharacterized protein n=1 Tax=Glycine max TaxID=3847 RepID=UPI0003DE80D8|nr:uncharacterized protein LOC112999778 [Glycine max]|eukprot:XP_025981874.1 uncharacterized protein LOC112999778 [Glycine max]
MVQEGIVLGHKISKRGIEVDKAKLDVIDKLPSSVNVKGIQSFLGHAGFYQKFIKDFSKIAKPLSNMLNKDIVFVFNDECLEAFNTLKAKKTLGFADMANFKAAGIIPKDLSWHQRKKFFHNTRHYIWDDPHLFKVGADNLLRRCVTSEEAKVIFWHCHNSPCGGHYGGNKTTTKVL